MLILPADSDMLADKHHVVVCDKIPNLYVTQAQDGEKWFTVEKLDRKG